MLKRVYPAVKAVDPQANILIGGLLLNCDPTNPPPNQDCKPAKFLEGILLNQGAQYFDILSFHAGAYYYPDPITGIARNNDETHPYWAHRGGIVLGKVDYLREVLDAYNVDKPIMQSEGGLYCHPTTECDNRFIEHQADYVAWLEC